MDYIATENGRVGHIVSTIVVSAEGRIVTTACGKVHNETELRVDNELDVCSACEGKEEKSVESAPEVVMTIDEVETASADDNKSETKK